MTRVNLWEENCAVLRDIDFRSKYDVEDNIVGEGSFGTVITAKCRKTGEQVAVKAIRKLVKTSMLSIELKILCELGGNFNIIKFINFFHSSGSIAIVMEYFPHCSVGELIMFSRKDASFALLYFRNLIQALAYLHLNGYVHRDIKLTNFLYSPSLNSFRLVDFGLATSDRSSIELPRTVAQKQLGSYEACQVCGDAFKLCKKCKSLNMRNQYHVVGTAGVRAPELLFGVGIYCPPVDIFSAGLCLLSLLALKHPFFMPKDETENIMDLACILGSKNIEHMASLEGIRCKIAENRPRLDLAKLILCLRFGFEPVGNCFKNWANSCKTCQNICANNENGLCLCMQDSRVYSTDDINDDLLILYIDLLYHSLETDRFQRYSADQLLCIIENYDARILYKPTRFSNRDD